MKFIIATLAAVAHANSGIASIKPITVTSETGNTATASMKWDATYSETENAAGELVTVDTFNETVTLSVTKAINSTDVIDYLICANPTGVTAGTCHYFRLSYIDSYAKESSDPVFKLPTDVASAEAIFDKGHYFSGGESTYGLTSNWDAAKKVHTSVESYDSSRTMSKEDYDIVKAKAAADLANGVVVTLEPVGKLKTTVLSAVQYKDGTLDDP